MSKQEVQDLIDEVDENNDGKLDYKEVSHCNVHITRFILDNVCLY